MIEVAIASLTGYLVMAVWDKKMEKWELNLKNQIWMYFVYGWGTFASD